MIHPSRDTEIKLLDGQKILLKDFFDSYYPGFKVFALGYISNSAACEDIVQDAFISFWNKRKSFPNLLTVKSFFYTTIKNSCLDFLKHSIVEEKYKSIQKTKEEIMDSFLVDVLKQETYNEIYSEISKLPEMGRKVLLLSLREKSNDEIANILNIAVNTVKTHKSRAYKVLRQNLGDLFLLLFPLDKKLSKS